MRGFGGDMGDRSEYFKQYYKNDLTEDDLERRRETARLWNKTHPEQRRLAARNRYKERKEAKRTLAELFFMWPFHSYN